MPIRLIIFDLDGTLVSSRELHYDALNAALSSVDQKYVISPEEHRSTYDGLPTKTKLDLLSKKKGLPPSEHDRIWKRKQEETIAGIERYLPDFRIIHILAKLKEKGLMVYIASNSVWKNILHICLRKGFLPHIDWFISNEDVQRPKPSPDIYLKCLLRSGVTPSEALIIEDSPIGRTAALASGCHTMFVNEPSDLTLESILSRINTQMAAPNAPFETKMNVVIPMAGDGSRFSGYTFPKPLIDVRGKTMIEVVVRNLSLKANFIFIVRKKHRELYDLDGLLPRIAPGCSIISVDEKTEGAACTILKAKELINNETPLLLANSDQFLEWNVQSFLYEMKNVDCGIATFESTHPKWSYTKLRDDGFVSEIAEKRVISNIATCGIYYFGKGKDFVEGAERMISKNIRVNGEFYTAPAINELILDGKTVRVSNVKKMHGIGTPEDLDTFLANYDGPI